MQQQYAYTLRSMLARSYTAPTAAIGYQSTALHDHLPLRAAEACPHLKQCWIVGQGPVDALHGLAHNQAFAKSVEHRPAQLLIEGRGAMDPRQAAAQLLCHVHPLQRGGCKARHVCVVPPGLHQVQILLPHVLPAVVTWTL